MEKARRKLVVDFCLRAGKFSPRALASPPPPLNSIGLYDARAHSTHVVWSRTGRMKKPVPSFLRLPAKVNEDVQEDPSGTKQLWERGNLNGASQKTELLSVFYVGDQITTLQKTSLVPGASDALVYTTIGGAVGMLVPFISRDEYEFFQNLEMHLRVEHPPIAGRDHLSFRSYYAPCKAVIDGDLCEQFVLMDSKKQADVADELGKTQSEVR
ncbi:hypothetical protein PRIPAC_86458 [Pristionchus pacificus]|uniref:CPSF_A domain-containing protein n=1 Tax=Pristionchus pacificus TaxID=54126 RepID=A0A2A6CCF2_PRIPA|nr:hypothetical protein PRIPAC_86458 [Pristionchus pacificus]|eukprot:PDM75768.1 hypothetical protein PRIPAC_40147 [Pristionchus pacificus]